MSESQIQSLKNIVFTLNTISVSGVENMDRMLGCIQLLNQITDELDKKGVDADGT